MTRRTVDRFDYETTVPPSEAVYPKSATAAREELRARGVACDLLGDSFTARQIDAIVDAAECSRGCMLAYSEFVS